MAKGANPPPQTRLADTTRVAGSQADQTPVQVEVAQNGPLDVNVTNPVNINVGNLPNNLNVTLNNLNPVVNPSPQINDSAGLTGIIQNRSAVFSFNAYKGLMDSIFRGIILNANNPFVNTGTNPLEYVTGAEANAIINRPLITISGVYDLLKFATERYVNRVFDTANSPIAFNPPNPNNNSYIDLITQRINEFFNINIPQGIGGFRRLPILIELIWNYWHEEGMLVQTMLAISSRFQNKSIRKNGSRDPLANLETDPLRPLNNILWGYIQDEQHRLTIKRRAYEYEHEYGLTLIGEAVQHLQPVERRSDFILSFHDLLHKCSILFKESDDRTRTPDGFPVLNSLKSLHLVLSEGAHNQFGDLPQTARVEMLIEQWILSQPEIREFLGGRVMVPYREAWMDRVDTMKNLQGWPSPSIMFYNDLARFGEQLILHIRWTSWTEIFDPNFATQWAIQWRPIIQNYIHAYQVVTNIDLSADAPETHKNKYQILPSFLIKQKYDQENGSIRIRRSTHL
jgi:hypothetical protein